MHERHPDWSSRDQTLILIGLVIIGGLLFMLDLVGFLAPLRNVGDFVTNPVLYWTRQATSGLNQLTQSVTDWSRLKEENISLRKEVLELRSKEVQSDTLQQENDALRQQLKATGNIKAKYVIARPLSYDIGEQVGTIKINQGEANGVKVGQLVVVGNYFVGKVDQTNRYASVVKTIFASNMELKGKLANNKTKGILRSVSNSIVFEQVLATNPLVPNDVVLLWEEGHPLDVLIGKVTETSHQKASPYQQATVKPFIDYTDLDYVFVIRDE